MGKDRFETIKIGDEEEIYHIITARDVDTFATLTGDNNPLHMDEIFASKTTFKRRVAHGMLTASFISAIIGTKLPGEGALWYEQKLRFLSSVSIGERIRILARVKQKSPAQKVIIVETLVFGEKGRKIIEGEAKVKVLELEEEGDTGMVDNKKGAVIITGASRGIGATSALALGLDGYPVIVNFLNSSSQADEVVKQILAQGGNAAAFQADVTQQESVEEMVAFSVKKFGTISGIVNNASSPVKNISFDQISWEDIQADINVHVKGAFNLCHAALPHFLRQGYGNIVNMVSIFADNVPPPMSLSYTLAKSALVSFSRSLAVEYGPKNIRINCVAPGMTQTDLIANIPERAKMVAKMQTPLRRLANPEDVAGVVSFLFCEKAKHIMGENIRVCGGAVMV